MNIKNLIKINFISIFKGMFGYKKMRQGRRFALTAILLLALIYFAFGNLMDMMMQYFVALKSPSYVLFMGAIITFAFVLFFITYESQNYFFKTKDFDLLASLPLKNIEIVIAKYTSVLLSAYLYASFFMFPSIVVYFMYVPFNFVTLLLLIVSFVFMPLVPMALGTLLGLLVSFLSSKLKKQNIISIILFLVLFVAYFFLYFYMNKFTTQIVELGDNLINNMQYYLPSVAWFFKGFVQIDVVYIFLDILLSVFLTILAVALLSLLYKKINFALTKTKSQKNKKAFVFKQKSQISSFLGIEAKRFFSLPIYVLNSGISLLLLIAMPIILYFSMSSTLPQISNQDVSFFSLLIIFISTMFAGMCNTTYASISIEAKQIDTLKSLPIKYNKIFFAKILFNIILALPFEIVSSIISIALFYKNLSVFSIFMLVILPIMSTISLSVLGLVLNLYMPKFNYDNVNQIIKQSISLLIIILANLAITMLPLFTAQSVSISFSTLLSLILLLYVLIFVIGLIILKINGAKLYKKLHF